MITLGANTDGRALGDVSAEIRAKLDALGFPPGYGIIEGGQGRDQAEVFRNVFTALGIAVLMMYLILVVQFGSFLDPIAILISLPLSLIGVVLALLVFGSTLNMFSIIGIVMLMGLVTKNAILLVDFTIRSRADGMERSQALLHAAKVRLRPILMLSLIHISEPTRPY